MERIRSDMNTHYERMMAIIETGLQEMKTVAEHQEVAMEEAAVKSLGTMKKRHSGRHLTPRQHGEPKELIPGECGSIMQQWHGTKEMSTGKFRPSEIVDQGWNWLQQARRWPAVQRWDSARDVGFMDAVMKNNKSYCWKPCYATCCHAAAPVGLRQWKLECSLCGSCRTLEDGAGDRSHVWEAGQNLAGSSGRL